MEPLRSVIPGAHEYFSHPRNGEVYSWSLQFIGASKYCFGICALDSAMLYGFAYYTKSSLANHFLSGMRVQSLRRETN